MGALCVEGAAMGRSRSVSLVLVVWLVIGVIVAYSHQYMDNLKTIGGVVSALLAIVLWPIVLLGTKIALNV
jgi:uncharacterized BrkB/YihY/UPF0761 family membrane protein